jgi:hypothetical protein
MYPPKHDIKQRRLDNTNREDRQRLMICRLNAAVQADDDHYGRNL